MLYIATKGKKIELTETPSAHTQRKRKKKYLPVSIIVPGIASDYPLFSTAFKNLAAENYRLVGGAVNTQTPCE